MNADHEGPIGDLIANERLEEPEAELGAKQPIPIAHVVRGLLSQADVPVTVRLQQSRRGGIETAVEAVAGPQGVGRAGVARPELNPG